MTDQARHNSIDEKAAKTQTAGSSTLGSVLVTSALLLLSVALAWVLGIMGILLAVTNCSAADCSGLTIGSGIATFGPAAVVLISIVISIVRLVQRRRAFWVPIIGMVVAVLMTVLGGAVAFVSIG
ncbi:hypothetical protein [Cryobacterium ruanii]|uniref:Transmembrane protein n=1 Tax=Cryobacterium ruanii TaxID=1259197 RepID=A0A4R9AJX2_9MICO|nr:hypothetical protein [Cryobacterium ruanii]TFD63076.1 hypothetical protein E3T47_15530 [Cryobacterium ruanii]